MPAERPAKSLLTAPTLGETHPNSRAGKGAWAGTAQGVPGVGGSVCRSSLRSDCRSPARGAGTGKSGSSATRCQDTLAFKPELGPISPGAGEHQPHVIRHRRLSERKSVTAVTQPVGGCLCADWRCPRPGRLLEASSARLGKTKEPRRREGKRALCMCSFSTSQLQPGPWRSPRRGEAAPKVISAQEQWSFLGTGRGLLVPPVQPLPPA